MNDSNSIAIIFLVILSAITFAIGFFIAYKVFSKRFGELKNIQEQKNQFQQKLDKIKNELWEATRTFDTQKQDMEVTTQKINEDFLVQKEEIQIITAQLDSMFNDKKEYATQEIERLQRIISERQQEFNNIYNLTKDLQKMQSERQIIENAYAELPSKQKEIENLQVQINDLKSELSLYSEAESYIEYGFYPLPSYGEASSKAYNEQLKIIRQKQKDMLKNESAYTTPTDIEITGNQGYDNQLAKNQGKLLIFAFNSECEYLISRVNSANYEATMTKIEKLAEQLEKNLLSLEIGISIKYIEFKMQECTVYYQYICKKNAEAEEQREIKAQLREEIATQREIEKAMRDAEREEEILQQAMNKVRTEMEFANLEQKQKYESQLQQLNQKLTEAELRSQRAMSMAQQTKQGHVYIISNIGSFGENIYKIGMTRRLEPLDRVRELGDASVPFAFDVHAMIFSEDAPALERELHIHFDSCSVNKINYRKEFFEVDLHEVRKYLDSKGVDTHWTMVANATEYRQSLEIAEQRMLEVA